MAVAPILISQFHSSILDSIYDHNDGIQAIKLGRWQH